MGCDGWIINPKEKIDISNPIIGHEECLNEQDQLTVRLESGRIDSDNFIRR